MKKKVYLHIGQTKTATTTLQAFFYQNKNWLRDNGVLYPEVPTEHPLKMQHRYLVDSIHNGSIVLRENTFNKLKESINNFEGEKILISEEVFFHIFEANPEKRVEAIKWLKESLIEYDVYIVCYLRDELSWIESWYNQLVKDPIFELSKMDFKDFFYKYEKLGIINYYSIISAWSNEFGREKIILRAFDKNKFKNGNIIFDFCDILGVEMNDNLIIPENKQVGLGYESILFLKNYNSLPTAKRFKPYFRGKLKQEYGQTKDFTLVNPDISNTINELHVNSNEGFYKDFNFLTPELKKTSAQYKDISNPEGQDIIKVVSHIINEQQKLIVSLRRRIEKLENNNENFIKD